MNELIVSEIQIVPLRPKNGLVAFASCVINNQFYLGNIALYTSPSSPYGLRLVYPTITLKNSSKLSVIYPISKDVGSNIEKQIVEEYLKLINNLTKGADAYEQK